MTSSTTVTPTQGLRPTDIISHSSETSPQSSKIAKRVEFKSRVKNESKIHIQSVLQSLGAIAHEPLSYSEMREFEILNNAHYLGKWFDIVYYIPAQQSLELYHRAIDAVTPVYSEDVSVGKALYELWLVTKTEKMNELDRDAMMAAYIKKLGEFSPAAVRIVLHEMMETSTWWPAWSEIQNRLAPYVTDTQRLHRALTLVLRKEAA